MYSSFLFLYRSKCLPEFVHAHKIFTRSMGGGPRTFPGGLNKWQWKRMHEKKAKEKETRLLDQEKQLYQSRIRTQIRSQVAGSSQLDPDEDPDPNAIQYTPMSPKEHVKALADRFVKEGAEDLWNDKDGPLVSDERSGSGGVSHQPGSISSPVDLRRLVPGGGGNALRKDDKSYDLRQFREFSTGRGVGFRPKSGSLARISDQKVKKFRRNESSSSDDDEDYGLLRRDTNFQMKMNPFGNNSTEKPLIHKRNDSSSGIDQEDKGYGLVKRLVNKSDSVSNSKNVTEYMKGRRLFDKKNWRIQQHEGNDDVDQGEEENEEERGSGSGRGVRKIGSSAALGKYDRKITKRVPLQAVQKEGGGFAKEVESIRYELEKRKKELGENKGEKSVRDREETVLSEKRFDESGISPLTIKALTEAGYVRMTRVQEATLSVCLEGKDALVKAKTGTGKSAAFLLPAIEAVVKATSSKVNARAPPVYVLILCPTRELASQIAAEANALLKHHIGIGVQTLIGGTRFKVDQKRLESDPCQIIVATPGRLLDHIENRGGITVRLMGLKMLILDEADHLLDLGFRKDMEKIVDCLPRQRQSLLFSATIPKEVRRICQLVLMKEHTFIDTVGMGCVETPVKVKQSFLIIPHELHFQVVHHLLKEHTQEVPDHKVIVFCSTGMVTSLMYELMRGMKLNVREIHSRKPQLHRTRVSDEFKDSKRLILVTSDVSARGMNYPDVTLVIQVGIPSDREQYIHRLGRTGREGKDGEGILLIAPWEKYFLDELQDLPLEKYPPPNVDPETKLTVEDSMSNIDSSIKEAAYHAWLGYYNSIRETGRDKTTLVELANQFSESIGLPKPPSLFRKTALKMGLKDIPGIRIRR